MRKKGLRLLRLRLRLRVVEDQFFKASSSLSAAFSAFPFSSSNKVTNLLPMMAPAAWWMPLDKVNLNDFGLDSVRKGVARFLETCRNKK